MSVAAREIGHGRGWLYRTVGVMALALFAACGGERDSANAGTEGVAATDTAPAPPADTVAPAGDTARASTDRSRDTAGNPAAPDTAAKQPSRQASRQPSAPAAPKPTVPAAKPAAPAADTASAAADTPATAQRETAQADSPQADTSRADTATGQAETADAPLRDAYHQAPKDTVDQTTYDGWKQYNLNCARCHGEDVLGSTIAPHLIMSVKPNGPVNTQEAFTQVVCAGRPAKGMPSWCALGMEPAKINQIYSYVKGRSDGKIGPGRPAVKSGG